MKRHDGLYEYRSDRGRVYFILSMNAFDTSLTYDYVIRSKRHVRRISREREKHVYLKNNKRHKEIFQYGID